MEVLHWDVPLMRDMFFEVVLRFVLWSLSFLSDLTSSMSLQILYVCLVAQLKPIKVQSWCLATEGSFSPCSIPCTIPTSYLFLPSLLFWPVHGFVALLRLTCAPLPLVFACSHCIQQILEAVLHCHQMGVVHRDLKVSDGVHLAGPSNLYICVMGVCVCAIFVVCVCLIHKTLLGNICECSFTYSASKHFPPESCFKHCSCFESH